MRNAFIDELVLAAREHKNVALVVGDLGYKVVEPFADEFPDRFFNAGIAEQNMMGLSAGLASEGVHVFVYSIANFPTFRCAEQIRNDVDYHRLSVTTVSVGGGLAYGNLGYSHHAVQDYALMRVMPNMLIAAPGDPLEVRACMRYLLNNPGPSYLRLGKAGEKCVHASVPEVLPGVWLPIGPVIKGLTKTVLSTGAALETAIAWRHNGLLNGYNIHSLPLWGMACKANQEKQIADWSEVVTVEDHLVDAGFGSWMFESVFGTKFTNRLKVRGLDSKICGMVGKQSTLNALGGLDPQIF